MPINKHTYYNKRYNQARKSPDLWKPILIIVLVTLSFLGIDLFLDVEFIANEGPVSSAHSLIADECNRCHNQTMAPSEGRMEKQCTQCHQDNKPLKFHLAAYQTPGVKKRKVKPVHCSNCHQEHRGREFRPAKINDRPCRDCHAIHDPEKDHPEFDSEKLEPLQLEAIGLRFNHASHQIREKNSDKINQTFEKGCFLCHQLDRAQGFMNFKPIRFEENCKDCHPLQELMLTWMFDEDELEGMAKSIQGLVQQFGFESYDSFLSRFEYRQGNKRRRRPSAFKYKPVHRDPYLKLWFAGKEDDVERVKSTLSHGKKGTTLNCLKCHVLDEKSPVRPDRFAFIKGVSLREVMPEKPDSATFRFPHKKHATEGCDQCHENILKSESLSDQNIQIGKMDCFNCHNKRKAENQCTWCHGYHAKGDSHALTQMLSAGGFKPQPSRKNETQVARNLN